MRVSSSLLAAALALVFASCAEIEPGKPRVTGKQHLVSPTDLQAAMRAAQQRLIEEHRNKPIYRLHVVSASRIEAFYGTHYSLYDDSVEHLVVERVRKRWKVTDVVWHIITS